MTRLSVTLPAAIKARAHGEGSAERGFMPGYTCRARKHSLFSLLSPSVVKQSEKHKEVEVRDKQEDDNEVIVWVYTDVYVRALKYGHERFVSFQRMSI